MKRIDVHIHSGFVDLQTGRFDGNQLLNSLGEAGFDAACVFSQQPSGMLGSSRSGLDRLDDLMKSCEDFAGRLFPVMWVHPDQPDLYETIQAAAERGAYAFKCICTNFYVYEDKSLRMLEAIAATGKPVMFHSGILWDDTVSSKYNRPLHWEALCTIPNLRFSLAHCSWPWYDECLALYGKFLTNHMKHPELNNEMYFDMTPGTPVPYRKDLYTKLMLSGYDVRHNILWGTDCNAENYNYAWTKKWFDIDNAIMDELNEPAETRELIFHGNLERFFGLTKEVYVHQNLNSDGST